MSDRAFLRGMLLVVLAVISLLVVFGGPHPESATVLGVAMVWTFVGLGELVAWVVGRWGR